MFKPLFNNVLVKIDETEVDTTTFYMPESVLDETTKCGTVISVGPGIMTDDGYIKSPVVKDNDRVIMLKMVGNRITIDNEEYTLIKDTDVLGIMED